MATIASVTRDGGALQLDAAQVQGLRGALRGPVLVAGDPGTTRRARSGTR